MTELCEFEFGECEVSIGYGALKWCRGKLIGKGGFGSVYIAKFIKPTSENTSFPSIMAVKSDRATDSSSPLMNEGKVLEALKGCPCVIQTYGSDITTNNKGDIIYNLFMEFASLGSLTDSIIANPSAFSDKLVRLYTQSILIGLRDIHGHGFVHCDIKPDNILFVKTEAGYKAKVADFGLAKRRNVKSGSPGVRGTSWFYSPEMVRYGIQEAPSDIWALGCTVLIMFTGSPPWGTLSGSELVSHIASETPPIPNHISEAAKHFLKCCFERNPIHRWTATRLLGHPFLVHSD
jgi:serine/threonine protein kinase